MVNLIRMHMRPWMFGEAKIYGASGYRQQLSRKPNFKIHPWAIPLSYSTAAVVFGVPVQGLVSRWQSYPGASHASGTAIAIDCFVAFGAVMLTGILFALEFFVSRFSAFAYSPRLVPWITGDRVLMHSIGVFAATFINAITALVWADRPDSGPASRVDTIIVVCLFLTSAGMFVRMARQLSTLHLHGILVSIAERGRHLIDERYPFIHTGSTPAALVELDSLPVSQTFIVTGRPRTLLAVDRAALIAAACKSGGVIEVVSAIGDTIGEGIVLLHVRGARGKIAESALAKAVTFGDGRSFEQGPKYAIQLLTEIAVRALSPAVTDPSIAVEALDHIEDLLLRIGRRCLDVGEFRDDRGELRLVVPTPTWDDFLVLALEEIRRYGATSIRVMRRMQALLSDLIEVLPPERRSALRHERERLEATVARTFDDDHEIHLASVGDRQGLGAPHRRYPMDAGFRWPVNG